MFIDDDFLRAIANGKQFCDHIRLAKLLLEQRAISHQLEETRARLQAAFIRTSNMLNTAVPHRAGDPDDPCFPDCARCALEKQFQDRRVDDKAGLCVVCGQQPWVYSLRCKDCYGKLIKGDERRKGGPP